MKRELILLVILTIIWSLFFAIYKYFIWGIFKDNTITLQYLSAYISIGSIGAYIIGSFLFEIIREKKFHAITGISILFLLILFFLYYFFQISGKIIVITTITIFTGFFYGLWGILKNILIASEIHKNYTSETKINGIINISFITSIVVGSIIGGIIVEKIGVNGFYLLIGLSILAIILGLKIEKTEGINKNLKKQEIIKIEKEKYLFDFIFIFKKYFIEMIYIGLLLVIATILSQKAIEHLVDFSNMKQSTASLLLLWSALGSIIGNLISGKINKNKWLYFMIYSILFALSTISLAIFINNFNITSIIAFLAGVFFGMTYNLLEADFFKKIANDDKKSYGAASLGIIVAGVITIMMIISDKIQNMFGFLASYGFLSIILIIIGISIFFKNKKLGEQ